MLDPQNEEIVRDRVLASGLIDEHHLEFFISAWRAGAMNARSLRKFGTRMSAEEKWQKDILFRGVVTHEFWNALNEHGRTDLEAAVWAIAGPVLQACATARDFRNAREAGIELFRFRASNMLAGPCPRATKLDNKCVAFSQVVLLPFKDCVHPEQCGCGWQACLDV